jgi:hypothetical protein
MLDQNKTKASIALLNETLNGIDVCDEESQALFEKLYEVYKSITEGKAETSAALLIKVINGIDVCDEESQALFEKLYEVRKLLAE